MKRTTLFCTTLATLVVSSFSYADVVTRDPQQTQINSKSNVDQSSLHLDLLRQQKLSNQSQEPSSPMISQYTGRELVENPELLEKLFVNALVVPNKAILPGYIKLYNYVKNKDQSLIDWANAILLRDEDLNQSVRAYRSLITHFPNNNYLRFQLAETLFYNQEFSASKEQFERLRSEESLAPQDIEVFDRFIDVINKKDDWNFAFGATFLNDKNLSNSAKQGTQLTLPDNKGIITYNTPRQKGQGISSWVSVDKKWNTSNGKYFALESSLSSKYYWDNKKYNDLTGHLGVGFGYSDARFNLQFTPYLDKRWYAGGANSTESLKQYSNTYGANLSSSYWLNEKFKYSFYYSYGYEKYDRAVTNSQYAGPTHTLVNSLMYMPSAKQYWSISLDLNKKDAKDDSNSYDRIGSRLTWGQEWPLGMATSTTLGYAQRNYKEASFLGKQKNKEMSASLTVWNKALHFKGFTPRLTYSYTKTDSNIAIYSYDKSQLLFDVSKSF
ncbi:hypothetical protein A1D22_01460 [Pasteurellaceae bacterium LFhippo2]|nr:hypothetical protein [Pasteurellaceae bacterium LFhippo2]